MKLVHWFFVLSLALFVSAVGFVVATARSSRGAQTVDRAPIELIPVASVKQIMNGIVNPAAIVVFGSVGTTITAAGAENIAPATNQQWQTVGDSAAALIESANLMLMGSRVVDSGAWTTEAHALAASGTAALKAVEAKDTQRLFEAGGAIYEACSNCHNLYQRGS